MVGGVNPSVADALSWFEAEKTAGLPLHLIPPANVRFHLSPSLLAHLLSLLSGGKVKAFKEGYSIFPNCFPRVSSSL